MELNSKQQKVYDFLLECESRGLPPTVREICAATGLGSTSTAFSILNVLEEKGLITRASGSSRAISVVSAAKSVSVPLVGVVTAGLPILAIENIEEYLPLPASVSRGREMFALRVKGMSMMNAGILSGDIVYAEKTPSAEQGDILLETRSRYFIAHSRLRNGRATRSLDALILREGIGERYRTSVLWVHEPVMPGIDG